MFNVGDMVVIQSRTWPGINKPGGVAKVIKVNVYNNTIDVKYTLGGSEKNIEFIYAKLWDIYLTSSAAAARRTATTSSSSDTATRYGVANSKKKKNSSNKISSTCKQPNAQEGDTNLINVVIPRKIKHPSSESSNHWIQQKKDIVEKNHKAAATVVETSSTKETHQPAEVLSHDGKENRLEQKSKSKSPISASISAKNACKGMMCRDASMADITNRTATPTTATCLSSQNNTGGCSTLAPSSLPTGTPTATTTTRLPLLSTTTATTRTATKRDDYCYHYSSSSIPHSPLPPKKRMLLRTSIEEQQQQYSYSHEPKSTSHRDDSEDLAVTALSQLGGSSSFNLPTSRQRHPTPFLRNNQEGNITDKVASLVQEGEYKKNNSSPGEDNTSSTSKMTQTTGTAVNSTISASYTTDSTNKARGTLWKKRHHLLSSSIATPSPTFHPSSPVEDIYSSTNKVAQTTNKATVNSAITSSTTSSTKARGTLWKKRHHLLSSSLATPSPTFHPSSNIISSGSSGSIVYSSSSPCVLLNVLPYSSSH